MIEEDLQPKSFTQEKSLWAIYRKARRIPSNKFNVVTTTIVFLAACLTCWLSENDIPTTLKFVRDSATLSFNACLTLLGFLVAGFTIFATISNPNMLVRMGELRHGESGLSWLKYTFFSLIRAFIYFIVFTIFCFLIIFEGSTGGLISLLVKWSQFPHEISFAIVKISYVLIITGQYFILMQLKSFIFNIYHTVMATLRWRAEGQE
jgi:hypothetical protein